jgi:hypothetical protein
MSLQGFNIFENLGHVKNIVRSIRDRAGMHEWREPHFLKQVIFYTSNGKINSIYLYYGCSTDVLTKHHDYLLGIIYHLTLIKYYISENNLGLTSRDYYELFRETNCEYLESPNIYRRGNILLYYVT